MLLHSSFYFRKLLRHRAYWMRIPEHDSSSCDDHYDRSSLSELLAIDDDHYDDSGSLLLVQVEMVSWIQRVVTSRQPLRLILPLHLPVGQRD